MACWLVKTEPSDYAFEDLERDGGTVWDGVTNALAQRHLRAMAAGDEVFVYHTGEQKAVVGLARVAGATRPAPAAPRAAVVDLAPLRRLARTVTLAEIKADPAFGDFALVRNSRLSVMPVAPPLRARLLELAES